MTTPSISGRDPYSDDYFNPDDPDSGDVSIADVQQAAIQGAIEGEDQDNDDSTSQISANAASSKNQAAQNPVVTAPINVVIPHATTDTDDIRNQRYQRKRNLINGINKI